MRNDNLSRIAIPLICFVGLSAVLPQAQIVMANEVLEEAQTEVIVREHPKTGKPFVSIVRPGTGALKKSVFVKRPDYRLLDPKIDPKGVPYSGPVSDRRKVYIFAATVAALGAAGGVIGTLAPAAASTGGTAGGAGLYAGGAVLTGGGAITASTVAQSDNQPADFKMYAETVSEGQD